MFRRKVGTGEEEGRREEEEEESFTITKNSDL